MNIFSGLNAAWLALFVAVALPASADSVQSETVWEGGDQFVSIVPLEEAAQPNHQPTQLAAETIAAVFSSIKVSKADTAGEASAGLPLLQPQVANQLGANISTALGQAGPREDVVFAVNTTTPTGLIGKEKVSVAARVFYRDGRLHLILGDVFRSTLPEGFYSDPNRTRQIDRRLYPHKPGSRTTSVPSRYQVAADGNRSGLVRSFNGERGDWMLFDLAGYMPGPEAGRNSETMPADAAGNTWAVLEPRLTRLKELLNAGLLDKQSYQNLVQEAVREDMFGR
tara:strand:+ start:11380 stop:12225 length:846 start_codon:yes stop_codon:yes gene_type:complete